jgi:pimeloyl-ACP methyl ester carboxylesterase
VKERPVVFGPNGSLVGIIAENATSGSPGPRIACIFINAGLVHRVGPNRLYVRLSRMVASLGFPTLRFDLSNRGDSDVRQDGLPFIEGSVVDIGAAMDLLQKAVGAEKFVLMGICSGAVNSLHVATLDERVIGAIAIDGPAYQTAGYYLRWYCARILSPRVWGNAVTGRTPLRRLTGPARRIDPRGAEDEFRHAYSELSVPSKEESERVMHQVLDRGAKLLFIYTGSWPIYNYEHQFRDAFPAVMKRGGVRVVYAPDADHTFSRLHHQQRLLDIVKDWFTGSFGAEARSADRVGESGAAAR